MINFMEYIIRLATINDIVRIMQIIEQAKEQMSREGKQQWNATYPTQEHIINDIKDNNGYVMCKKHTIAAYGAIIFSGESSYSSIQGKWLTEGSYVVLHRLAVADEMKQQGIATMFIKEVEKMSFQKGIYSFKVDTNYDNIYMQRTLGKLGFACCGEIIFQEGSRMAYEKIIIHP